MTRYCSKVKKLVRQRIADVNAGLGKIEEYSSLRDELRKAQQKLNSLMMPNAIAQSKKCAEIKDRLVNISKAEMYYQGYRDCIEFLNSVNMLPK